MGGSVIAITATKGGVGKSTIARYLGVELGLAGKKVCIVDMDENGHIALGLEGKKREVFQYTTIDWLKGECKPSEVIHRFVYKGEETNVYYIPSNQKILDYEKWVNETFRKPKDRLNIFKNKIEPLRSVFDYIILDMHPTEGDVLAYVFESTDFVLFPLMASIESAVNLKRDIEILVTDYVNDGYDIDFGIVPNNIDINALKGMLRVLDECKAEIGVAEEKYFPIIRNSTLIPRSVSQRKLLHDLVSNNYAVNVLQDLRDAAKTLEARINKGVKV